MWNAPTIPQKCMQRKSKRPTACARNPVNQEKIFALRGEESRLVTNHSLSSANISRTNGRGRARQRTQNSGSRSKLLWLRSSLFLSLPNHQADLWKHFFTATKIQEEYQYPSPTLPKLLSTSTNDDFGHTRYSGYREKYYKSINIGIQIRSGIQLVGHCSS